jgi:guanylate cyclase, other
MFREAKKYLYRTNMLSRLNSCNEIEGLTRRARSLLVVVSTPPTTKYDEFTDKVRQYNTLPPFEFHDPFFNHKKSYMKYISIYAAYLYDSVKLYAKALHQLLTKEKRPLTDDVIREVASNGTAIIEAIIQNRTYKSESTLLLFFFVMFF